MSDRPKLAIAPADLNVDQRLVYLYDQLKKLKTPVATTTAVSSSTSTADVDAFLRWAGIVTDSVATTITVPATAPPWAWVNGGLNTNYQFGTTVGATAPAVVSGLIPGQVLTISATGITSFDGGIDTEGPGGGLSATGLTPGSIGTGFPTKFMANAALSGVNSATNYLGIGGLAGAFCKSDGTLVSILAVGLGGTFVVPAGADQLQLGINDDDFVNNTGSFTATVVASSGAVSGYKVNDLIRYNGVLFVCTVNNPKGVLPHHTNWINYWQVVCAGTQDSFVNTRTGTAYTIQDGDFARLLSFSNAAAIAVTVPQAGIGSVFNSGWYTWIQNTGVGTLTITPTTSTIDGLASLALAQNQGCLIASDGTNYFTMRGAGGSGGGGTGVGAISITSAASPATLNLTTQGVVDWFILNGTTLNPPRGTAFASVHSKAMGGWVKNSFDWFSGVGGVGPAVGGSSSIAMTSTAADDLTGALTAVTPNSSNIGVNNGATINFGYRFNVPADSFTRTLKLNMAVNGVKATVTCRMVDGSVADQTTTVDAVADGLYVQKEVTIAYKAGATGSEMIVEVRVTTNYSTSTHLAAVYFISATLA